MSVQHDAISLMVIQEALHAACDEMFVVLKKTAMSPIIYEVLDVGTAVTAANGDLLSSGAGIPTFVGVLDKAVKQILELHTNIHEGDMFITNDPFYGGVTHLNDVVLALPVFAAGELIAWTATIAHWNDIGGMTAGSMSVKASEIFQEGLRLPAIKLFDKGQQLASVFDIIYTNSRLPDFVRGDLWAQIAACRIAATRLKNLIGSYGLECFNQAIEAAFAEGEQRSQRGLASLPKGTFTIVEPQDDGSVWNATITISNIAFIVDLRDNPNQLSTPHNTSRDGAVISCQMIFKALTDSSRFASAGSFKALQVLTREGSMFHATHNAAQAYY
ncbi:MAG: hydantoinase B/oxoprolinase family protein, partial [Deinococcota bacterium]